MISSLPPFSVTQVGSWPRSARLLDALREKRAGRMSMADFDALADTEVERCVALQEAAGVDMVVDGELRRDNFYSFLTEKVEGTQLMSLAEMLDTVEDKEAFEEMLRTLDAPAFAIRNPTCVGRLSRRAPLAADELRAVRRFTSRPVKVGRRSYPVSLRRQIRHGVRCRAHPARGTGGTGQRRRRLCPVRRTRAH
jgi:methionine synthase II (cobalamin-independent)